MSFLKPNYMFFKNHMHVIEHYAVQNLDSFIGHTASANGGVMSTTGSGTNAMKMSDIIVTNSSADSGGGFEVKNNNFECVRCALTWLQARTDATTTHPLPVPPPLPASPSRCR